MTVGGEVDPAARARGLEKWVSRRRLAAAALALIVALSSGGCGAFMYVVGGKGYRQLVTPYRDELKVRPEWRQFVEEHYREEAQAYLDTMGLPADTPLALEYVAANYYRQERYTELVAHLRPPEGSFESPMGTFQVSWWKRGKAGGGKSRRPWAPNRSELALLKIRMAIAATAGDIHRRIADLARSGRYPHLIGFGQEALNRRGVEFARNATRAHGDDEGKLDGPDACLIVVRLQHPAIRELDAGEDDFFFPDAALAVVCRVSTTPENGGGELRSAVRAIVAEEAARLAPQVAALKADRSAAESRQAWR